MDEKNNTFHFGLYEFALLLTAVFVVLKCAGLVLWSWFWVFFPLILVVGLTLLFMIMFLFTCVIVIALNEAYKDN